MADERQDKGFKVEDRRRFDAEGNLRADEPAGAAPGAVEPGGAPPITFSSFVIGLATQALMFLGAVAEPASGKTERNVAEASAIIDVIEMLAAKTKGNLSEDEARLIDDVLYDLRMRYVRESRRGAGEGSEKG